MRSICLITLFGLLLCHTITTTYAQDHIPHDVPFWKTWSVKRLSKALTKDTVNQYQAAYNIYYWITHHIRYDIHRYRHYKWEEITAKQTLHRRKALNGGYANLFQALCKEAGINAWAVHGYDKGSVHQPGEHFYWEEQAWNIIYADGNYYLADAVRGSGMYVRKKHIILKKICAAIHIPYINHGGVFKRKYNEQYFTSDTSWFVSIHLPVVPMWQIKRQPVSIDHFEKWNYKEDSTSISSIHFDSDIKAYNKLTTELQWLYNARKGNFFNNHNNRIKGVYFFKYLRFFSQTYNLYNPSADKAKKKIASAYADTAIVYTKKFLKDNDNRHNYVLDSIAHRNKIIAPFDLALINEDIKNGLPVNLQIKQNKIQIKNEQRLIHNKNKLFSYATSDNIDNQVSKVASKNVDTLAKQLKKIKEIYDLNVEKIDSLNLILPAWYDTIAIKIQDLRFNYDSIANFYYECGKFFKVNALLNAEISPLFKIQNNQKTIREKRESIRRLYGKNNAIQTTIYSFYFGKYIDPLNNKCIQLQKKNKALLKTMAKCSTDSEEKQLYREENRKMYVQLLKTTQRSKIKIALLEIKIEWLKKYKLILKKELKKINFELGTETLCNKISIRNEKRRNIFYQKNGDKIIASSQIIKLKLK
jgi:hypothetical protein